MVKPSDHKRPPASSPLARRKKDPARRTSSRIGKWVLRGVLAALALIVALVLLAPTLLSTDAAKRALLNVANLQIEGELEVREWAFGWLTGSELRDVTYVDRSGDVQLRADRVAVTSSWLRLLLSPNPDGVRVDNGHITLHTSDGGVVLIEDVELVTLPPSRPGQIDLAAHGVTRHGDLRGSFSVEVATRDWQSWEDVWQPDKWGQGSIQIAAQLSKWPVLALDRLLNSGQLAQMALGPTLDMDVDLQVSGETVHAVVDATADNVDAHLKLEESYGRLTLSEPGKIVWRVTPGVIETLTANRRMPLTLAGTVPVEFSLTRFDLATDRVNRQLPSIRGDLSVAEAYLFTERGERIGIEELEGVFDSGDQGSQPSFEMTLLTTHNGNKGRVEAEGTFTRNEPWHASMNISGEQVPSTLVDVFLNTDGLVRALAGPWVSPKIEAEGNLSTLAGTVEMQSPQTVLKPAPFAMDKTFRLSAPTKLEMAMSGIYLQEHLKGVLGSPIPDSLHVSATVDEFEIPLSIFGTRPHIQAVATIHEPLPLNLGAFGPCTLRDVRLDTNGKGGHATLTLEAQEADSIGTTTAKVEWGWGKMLSQLDPFNVRVQGPVLQTELVGYIDHFVFVPTQPFLLRSVISPRLFQQLTNSQYPLVKPTTITFNAESTPILLHKAGISDVELTGRLEVDAFTLAVDEQEVAIEKLTGNCHVEGGAGKIVLDLSGVTRIGESRGPLQLDATLYRWRPAIASLRGDLEIQTKQFPTAALAALTGVRNAQLIFGPSLDLHVTAHRPDWNQGTVDLSLTSEEAVITCNASLDDRGVNYTLESRGIRSGSHLLLEGSTGNLLDENNIFQLDDADWEISGRGTDLPVPLLMSLAMMSEPMRAAADALVGEKTQIEIRGHQRQQSGVFDLSLASENMRASVSGAVDSGVLTLSRPLVLEVDVTPKLSQVVLNRVNPLLVSAVGSDAPLRFQIDAGALKFPFLRHEQMEISQGRLDLGRVQLSNVGPLAMLLNFLKMGNVLPAHTTVAWFTPQLFSVKGGVVTAMRSDLLLADSFHLATWGRVDALNDEVDMVLALSSNTLRRAFGLEGIPDGQMLQIPLRGPTHQPKVDTATASTRLGTLLAKKKLGDSGKLLRGIIETIASPTDPVPPPTTYPFPWDDPEAAVTLPQPPPQEQPDVEKQVERKVKEEINRFLRKL